MARSPRRGAVAFVAALLLMLAFATQASAANFSVNTTDDTVDADTGDGLCADGDGKCSLRAAVEQANGTEPADVVTLPAGRYVFAPQAGRLVVDESDLTINGAGAADTVIDSDGWDQAFLVGGSSFVGSGFTVTGGVPCDCEAGGAFDVLFGSLELTDVRLTRNEVIEGPGGAIASFASVVKLTRVRVDHNAAQFGGGGIFSILSDLSVVDSVIEGNTTFGDGGGIANIGLDECECGPALVANAAALVDPSEFAPGQLHVSGTTLSDNVAGGRGGAVFNVPGDDFVIRTLLNGVGGGSSIVQTIENSTLSGNTAGTVPGCSDDCDFPAGAGGAIYNDAGDIELSLVNDTIAENHVLAAAGFDPLNHGGNIATVGIVNLRNTIVADGTAVGEHNNCASFHEGNRFTSQGNNLESTGNDDHIDDCNLTESSDKPNTDPKLGLLGDNGGPTPTHALRDGSPAIDAGSNDAGPGLDQRGGDRPPAGGSAGETRDIGAYEAYSLADLSVEAKADGPDPVTVGSPLNYTLVVRNSGPDKVNGVTLADTLPGGVELVSADGCTGGVSCALGTLSPGDVRTVTVVVRPTTTGTLTNTATISAAGITDTDATNDSAAAATQVNPAPVQQQQQQQQQEGDDNVVVNLVGPKNQTLGQFMNGIVVEADCTDEDCLRRFREHAAINTGATRIAGFNLTVSRGVLAAGSNKKRIRLRPCQSGSKNGRRHRRCVKNLRKAVKKAGKFRVKVVVSAVDAAGNKDYAKTFVNVGG